MASDTLEVNLADLTQDISNVIKSVRMQIDGNSKSLAGLTTIAKSNLVAAVNELAARIDQAAQSGGATINDSAAGSSTTYSGNKIDANIATARASLKAEILGPDIAAAYDTLVELYNKMQSGDAADQAGIANLATALGSRLRFDEAQTLTAAQQAQARTNIGAQDASKIGDTSRDFVSIFRAGLV
jgi:hypothetical protein